MNTFDVEITLRVTGDDDSYQLVEAINTQARALFAALGNCKCECRAVTVWGCGIEQRPKGTPP